MGRHNKPDTTGILLPAEFGRAERYAPGQSRDRRDPGYGLRDLRIGRWACTLKWSVFEHLVTVRQPHRSSDGLAAGWHKSPNLPAVAVCGPELPLQLERGTIDAAVSKRLLQRTKPTSQSFRRNSGQRHVLIHRLDHMEPGDLR